MGYDIFVADDPELERPDDDDPEFRDQPADEPSPNPYPSFSVNNLVMREFRAVMRAQGMLDDYAPIDPSAAEGSLIPAWKISSNGGEHVTPAEIVGSLALARKDPITFDEVELEDREWMKNRWSEWLAFLAEALEHGGIVVY